MQFKRIFALLIAVLMLVCLFSACANDGKSGSNSGSSGKTGSSGKAAEEFKLTAAEKKLVELYRAADSDTKKAAVSLLKGEKADNGILASLFSGAVDTLLGGKK